MILSYYRKTLTMKTLFTLPFTALLLAGLLTGCQKERSDSTLDDAPGANSGQTIAVSFSPNTIPISEIDSVVVDLISPNTADYHHFTLQKMGDRFATTSTVPEMGYEAFVIVYLRPENNTSYALLYRQLYGGGKEFIHKAAPKAVTDEEGWQLMGRVFDRENEFYTLVGVAPNNPLLYLYTNPQKRNYIYIDKSYVNNGQHVSGGSVEYVAETTLSRPVAIDDAFASTAAAMEGQAWNGLTSMTLAKNEQTGQENILYFEHIQ
jgi:hypothetical protein